MKKALVLLFAAALFSVTAPAALVLQADFSSDTGAVFLFNASNDSFSFTNGSTGWDWTITVDQSGGWPAPIVGYKGDFIAPLGGWLVGADTTTVPGLLSIAPVTGVGKLKMVNAGGTAEIEGDLEWFNISTLANTGGINISSLLNLSNIAYTLGSGDANFDALILAGAASITVTMQNILVNPPPQGDTVLDLLRQNGGQSSYSGSLVFEPVPEPGTYAMLGAGLLGLALLRRRTAK